LAIARAIFKNAPLIILDEPTAALDPFAEYEIYISFNKLIGEGTAIYISHRLSSCKFCDKIAVFDGGRLTEYGTHQDLVNNDGMYAKMWAAQAQYYA
ncbi:MAG: transporter, ATP-binding protein, partial [Lachnospiraceae bacterium]|nr:transporter, ATP-binding protein [Lachnospiraceae bacterium]